MTSRRKLKKAEKKKRFPPATAKPSNAIPCIKLKQKPTPPRFKHVTDRFRTYLVYTGKTGSTNTIWSKANKRREESGKKPKM